MNDCWICILCGTHVEERFIEYHLGDQIYLGYCQIHLKSHHNLDSEITKHSITELFIKCNLFNSTPHYSHI